MEQHKYEYISLEHKKIVKNTKTHSTRLPLVDSMQVRGPKQMVFSSNELQVSAH